MVKRAAFMCLLACGAVALSGCGVFHAVFYGPLNPRMACDPGYGDEPCGEYGDDCGDCRPCRPGLRPLLHRGAACDPCGSCDPCGDDCTYTDGHCGPLTWVFALFRPGCYGYGRGGGRFYDDCGCGERYWGEWYSDPPACRDPCDRSGNYVGPGYGGAPHAVPGGACSTCGRHGPHQPAMSEPQEVYEDQYAAQPARPAASTARPPAQRYAPRTASPYAPRVISQSDRVAQPMPRQAQR